MTSPTIGAALLFTQVALLTLAGPTANEIDILVSLPEDEAAVKQSVTFRGEFLSYLANRAVDGDVDTCSRTANTPPRWWRLTLKTPLNISRILVIGGKDRSGQELQMDKINVTIAPDTQTSALKCDLSEFLVVEDDYEWNQFNCSHWAKQGISTTIVYISDLREAVSELSLCEIRIYELVVQPDDYGQDSLIYEQGSMVQRAEDITSNIILLMGVLSITLLLSLL